MFRKIFYTLAVICAVSLSPTAQAANFNVVGREMARMLENAHYARLPYDEKLSARFFDEYIESLDPTRLYFLKSDIDEFSEKYRDQLHILLATDRSIPMAEEVFHRYAKRVSERVALAKELLEKEKFTFDGDRWVMNDRDEAPWPEDEAAAREVWKQRIEEALLSTLLRREQIDKRAKEQGKDSPFTDELEPRKKIALRYERLLKFTKEADTEDIANYFFSAVARAHDPHSEYLSARELEQFKIGVSNELIGIGAVLKAEDDGSTKIDGIVNNGPADKQGELKLGDRVVAVDSLNNGEWIDIMFMSLDKVVEKIRGKENTSVALKVEPADGASSETKIVIIEREVVTMKDGLATAEIYEYTGNGETSLKLGLLRIPSFYFPYEGRSSQVSEDVEKLIRRMEKEKIDGLAIDLRGNGGGSLEEVRRLTGFFVGRGPVVQIKHTSGQTKSLDSDYRKPLYNGPMVVFTDKGSASASEILAGALQDYNRAVIVGESSTFGKGTVQQPLDIGRFFAPMEDTKRAGYVKLTIQKFYRVSGDSTQKKGVVPDIILPSTNGVLEVGEAHADFALSFDSIRKAADFRSFNRQNLFIPVLAEKNKARISKNQEFIYLQEDISRIKKRLEENRSSLNREVRMSEIKENEARRKARNMERIKRFAKMEEQDMKALKIFRLTLDDIDAETLPLVNRENDRKRHMRRAKNKFEDLDDTPDWPSGIDAVKRESLMILKDLVESVKDGSIAGVLQKP